MYPWKGVISLDIHIMSFLEGNRMRKSILALVVLAACFVIPINGYCEAEETLFMDDDPRYPLVLAIALQRQYLELL